MKEIFFIDPLEKLNIKKDSSLLWALTAKERGREAYLLFEEDFYFSNTSNERIFRLYEFKGDYDSQSFYVLNFERTSAKDLAIEKEDVLHMRIDPPFDSRYLRYLWMLESLRKQTGVCIKNAPQGILYKNEKLSAYELESLPSYVGTSLREFIRFAKSLKEKGVQELIFKPLDLFQGIGVSKVTLSDEKRLTEDFKKKIDDLQGPVVVQPFLKEVLKGEMRATYLKDHSIGSIIKTPPEGTYLANIAQGARYEKTELSKELSQKCLEISKEFSRWGIDLISFDLLGGYITEINVTCPGLLVEVSNANGYNLCEKIIDFS